jgi:hypothetical protein
MFFFTFVKSSRRTFRWRFSDFGTAVTPDAGVQVWMALARKRFGRPP